MMQFSVSQMDHSPETKEAIVTLMLYSQEHGKLISQNRVNKYS